MLFVLVFIFISICSLFLLLFSFIFHFCCLFFIIFFLSDNFLYFFSVFLSISSSFILSTYLFIIWFLIGFHRFGNASYSRLIYRSDTFVHSSFIKSSVEVLIHFATESSQIFNFSCDDRDTMLFRYWYLLERCITLSHWHDVRTKTKHFFFREVVNLPAKYWSNICISTSIKCCISMFALQLTAFPCSICPLFRTHLLLHTAKPRDITLS